MSEQLPGRAESLHQIEHEVSALIRRIRRVIGDRARALHPDIQPSSYLLVAHVAEVGPVRSSAVVEAFGIDKGAVSRQVQHLVDLGLLRRDQDPEDGRAWLLSVTDGTRQRLAEVQSERMSRFESLLGDWSDADLASFAAQLERYNTSLSGPSAEPGGGVGRQGPAGDRAARQDELPVG